MLLSVQRSNSNLTKCLTKVRKTTRSDIEVRVVRRMLLKYVESSYLLYILHISMYRAYIILDILIYFAYSNDAICVIYLRVCHLIKICRTSITSYIGYISFLERNKIHFINNRFLLESIKYLKFYTSQFIDRAFSFRSNLCDWSYRFQELIAMHVTYISHF